MKRSSLTVVGLVLAATMAMTPGQGNTAPAGNVDLTRLDADTWLVTGLSPAAPADRVPGKTPGVSGPSATSSVESFVVSPQAGSRVTFVDADGNFAGIVSGALPDLDSRSTLDGMAAGAGALSYVVDRAGRSATLAWEQVAGAREYRVVANDGHLATTTALSTSVPLTALAPGDIVHVEAWGPVEGMADHDVISTMSAILGDYTASWADSLDQSELSTLESMAAAPAKTTFTFQTFIPDAYVKAPLLCGGSWPFPTSHYFKGDNRSFSVTSTRYRSKMLTELNWGASDRKLRYVGQTRRYKLSGGVYSFVDAKTASSSGMTWYGPNTYTSTRKNFITYHAVANPYCLGPLGKIDYDVSVVVDRQAGYNGFTAWGDHDRAPNYAFYYQDSSTGSTHHRFRGWNRGSFSCLSACTQTSFSVVK